MSNMADLPIDTSSEDHRHACEVRYVANLMTDGLRAGYLAGVAEKRGVDPAKRLRREAWALMQGRR